MRRFPFGVAVRDLKLAILARILIRDSLKLLQVNKELRHFIRTRGPLHRKRFKRLCFTLWRKEFTEDAMIADLLNIADREKGGDILLSSIHLEPEVNTLPFDEFRRGDLKIACAKFFDVTIPVSMAIECAQYFLKGLQDEAFCCESISFTVRKERPLCSGAEIRCTIPLKSMSEKMRVLRNFTLSEERYGPIDPDFETNYEFVRRFHPQVMNSFTVFRGICEEAMLGTNMANEMSELLENMINQCWLIRIGCQEKLIPKILPKLADLKTLIIDCGRTDFVDTAKKLVEDATYHHVEEILLIGANGHDRLVFETALVIFEDEAITAIKNHRPFRALIDSYKRLQAKLHPSCPTPKWTNREENKVLVQWTDNQPHAFLLQQSSHGCVYFYTRHR